MNYSVYTAQMVFKKRVTVTKMYHSPSYSLLQVRQADFSVHITQKVHVTRRFVTTYSLPLPNGGPVQCHPGEAIQHKGRRQPEVLRDSEYGR